MPTSTYVTSFMLYADSSLKSSSSSSCGSTALARTLAASHRKFRNLIKTLGRTPLDEWSARRIGLYLHRTTQNHKTQRQTSMHPAGYEPTIPVTKQPSLRPRGHRDRPLLEIHSKISKKPDCNWCSDIPLNTTLNFFFPLIWNICPSCRVFALQSSRVFVW
jgi:hypothetical protein